MFTGKKKIEKKSEEMLEANQDLIVHNMPKPARSFSSETSKSAERTSSGGSFKETKVGSPDQPANFKLVGLGIMVGGFLVIGGLIYLGYRFMIAPSTGTPKPTDLATSSISEDASVTPEVPEEISPIATGEATATPAIVDVATSTEADGQAELTPSLLFPDTDNDSLNDSEETLLGSSATSTDTDADGYSDYAEVLSGYDPSGSAKISANPNLQLQKNAEYDYEILVPKGWPVQSVNNGATLIFTALDNSLIQISVQDNPDHADILSWYEDSFPDVTVSYDKVRSTYSWEGIMGENGLNFYLTDKNKTNIYVISYIPAVEGRVSYPTVFQMMINSLLLKR